MHVAEKFVGGLQAHRRPDRRLPDVHAGAGGEGGGAGVSFRYGNTISGFTHQGDRITSVETEHGPETADAYVCALGPFAPILMRAVGIRLPIYPIKGYSITLPVTDDAAAPQSTLMDETHKVAITRLGDRIRVAGQAEIIGYNAQARAGGRPTPCATW